MVPLAVEYVGGRALGLALGGVVVDGELQLAVLIFEAYPLAGCAFGVVARHAAFVEDVGCVVGGAEPHLYREVRCAELHLPVSRLHEVVGGAVELHGGAAYALGGQRSAEHCGFAEYAVGSGCAGLVEGVVRYRLDGLHRAHSELHHYGCRRAGVARGHGEGI